MITEKIILNNPKKYSNIPEISKNKLERAAEAVVDKLEERNRRFGLDSYPWMCSQNYKYLPRPNNDWQHGMYSGCNWLAYELTGNKYFRECAEYQLKSFRDRLDNRVGVDDHDLGFVFIPSALAAYKITGSEFAYQLAKDAAEYLYEPNYSKEGKFIIRNHKGWNYGTGCRTMMDSLMNAPLLFWGAEATGRPELYQAALDHTRTTEQLLIRSDGSSYHHYQFDPKTAGPVRGLTFQGYSDDSCWSRGHAWGVYGFALAYSYAHEEFLKNVHRGVSYYMLNHLPDDMIPCWDYVFTTPDNYRDASAACASLCGMREMASLLPESDSDKVVFESAAAQLLEAVIDNCTTDIGIPFDGFIHHVSHALPQGYGFDECAVYGDYFYLEALTRYLKPDWVRYW
ncbi:MAG: glycoside hydrolase family 88 protein [Clostridia bacterium]|nr:glycoside hydrolase family 88 protein [Clostridia bacterium]